MQITKYDGLTTDELLQVAYNELTEEDELALALMIRLGDVNDELDQLKCDYAEEVDYWAAKIETMEKALD